MKRVTERADLASKQVPEYISGCRQFEGEDLGKLQARGKGRSEGELRLIILTYIFLYLAYRLRI